MGARADFSRNNLDFLRLFFASIVVFYHLYALSGIPAFSPLSVYMSGPFAVKSFFVISGMLIYRSCIKSSSLKSYLEKRVRRIYPAYFTVIIVSALSLSSLSTLSPSQYFGLGFWKYIALNLLFLKPSGTLPGVFASNSLPTVNGVLWTLRVEVMFYIAVPVIALLCRCLGAQKVLATFFCLSLLWKYGFQWLIATHGPKNIYIDLQKELPGQMIYFIAGIALLLNFDRLNRHFPVILATSAGMLIADHFVFKGVLDVVWIAGFVFVFGFWRYLGNFSKHGDFSYGTYIVHFPLIQSLTALGLTRQGPLVFLLVTLMSILVAVFLLWHLVEERFLAKSSHYRQVAMASAS